MHVQLHALWRLEVEDIRLPTSDQFSRHSENLREVKKSLKQVELLHKRAIREGAESHERALRRVHLMVVGIYAESFLRKIVSDPTGFNDRERMAIWKCRSKGDQWLEAIDLSVRRHFEVPLHKELEESLSPSNLGRIVLIRNIIKDDLASIITDRNKLAHGEWLWQLKSGKESEFRVDSVRYDHNYSEISARKDAIEAIARIVNVLAVSDATFDRDYLTLLEQIDQAKSRFDGLEFDSYASGLRKTYFKSHKD